MNPAKITIAQWLTTITKFSIAAFVFSLLLSILPVIAFALAAAVGGAISPG